MLQALLAGFGAGFVGSMPVAGPIAVLVVARSLQDRVREAILIGWGAALPEASYAFLAYWGYASFLADVSFLVPLSRGIATAILLYLSYALVRYRPPADPFTPSQAEDPLLLPSARTKAGSGRVRSGSGSWGEGSVPPSATTRGLPLEEPMAVRDRASTKPSPRAEQQVNDSPPADPALAPMPQPRRGAGSFAMGFTIAALNPTLIVTWTAVLSLVASMDLMALEKPLALPFSAAAALGMATWCAIAALLINKYRRRLSQAVITNVHRVMGVLVFCLAVFFAVTFFQSL